MCRPWWEQESRSQRRKKHRHCTRRVNKLFTFSFHMSSCAQNWFLSLIWRSEWDPGPHHFIQHPEQWGVGLRPADDPIRPWRDSWSCRSTASVGQAAAATSRPDCAAHGAHPGSWDTQQQNASQTAQMIHKYHTDCCLVSHLETEQRNMLKTDRIKR